MVYIYMELNFIIDIFINFSPKQPSFTTFLYKMQGMNSQKLSNELCDDATSE